MEKETILEKSKRSNEDIAQTQAREEKEKEYKVFMQAHGSLPAGFTPIENTIEKQNRMRTVAYDGNRGDEGETADGYKATQMLNAAIKARKD